MKKQYIAPLTEIQQFETAQLLAASGTEGTLPGFTPGNFNW
jgi:hypothetical protein